jgi:hypothetical protein
MEGFFMSNLPDDSGQKPKSNTEASSSPKSNRPAEPTVKPATPQDAITKAISNNPNWSEAKDYGTGFVLGGMKPPTPREEAMRKISENPRFKIAKPSGRGFVILGARPSSGKPAAFETLLTTLRQDEPALGTLSLADQNWLVTALNHLIRIGESRRVENVFGDAYCIFEVGRAYFQCLAPSFGTYLRCESVSEKFVPEMGAILTPEKRDRLVREFGFTAPGYSKNFSRKIEIKGKDDLAYVARMGFRVLRDIYDVKDFSVTKFKLSISKPAISINSDPQTGENGPADS